jgi:hypothetical protein
LVDQKPVAAGKLFGLAADGVREIDRLLVHVKLLERERHRLILVQAVTEELQNERGVSRKETAGETRMTEPPVTT